MLHTKESKVKQQNFVQYSTMNDSSSLLSLWMHKLTRQQSKLKLLPTEALMNCFDSTTKLARIGTAWGTGPEVLNR